MPGRSTARPFPFRSTACVRCYLPATAESTSSSSPRWRSRAPGPASSCAGRRHQRQPDRFEVTQRCSPAIGTAQAARHSRPGCLRRSRRRGIGQQRVRGRFESAGPGESGLCGIRRRQGGCLGGTSGIARSGRRGRAASGSAYRNPIDRGSRAATSRRSRTRHRRGGQRRARRRVCPARPRRCSGRRSSPPTEGREAGKLNVDTVVTRR